MTDQPTIVLHLPVPPSANRIWRRVPGFKRMRLSDEYRKWRTEAGWMARQQLVGASMIEGAFNARIEVPEKSRRDRDNWSKPLFDLCQAIGAVRNDSGLCGYTVVPADRDDCMVAIWDLGGPRFAARQPLARKTVSNVAVAKKRDTVSRKRQWAKIQRGMK